MYVGVRRGRGQPSTSSPSTARRTAASSSTLNGLARYPQAPSRSAWWPSSPLAGPIQVAGEDEQHLLVVLDQQDAEPPRRRRWRGGVGRFHLEAVP
jgi:hypothetical protein